MTAPAAAAGGSERAAGHDWVVQPRQTNLLTMIREAWAARGLVSYVGRRTLQKMYRRTKLGKAWLFITPLFPFVLKTLVFGAMLKVPSDGTPYLLFLMAGSICWDVFASAVSWSTRGLQLHEGAMKQIYVPRLVLPIATMAPAFLDLLIKTVLLLIMGAVFAVLAPGRSLTMSIRLVWAPVAVLLSFLTALAIGLFTSVWGRRARDARLTMGNVLSVWSLLTPVLYPMSAVPTAWQPWLLLNPMAAAVETFKWSVLGVGELPVEALGTSFGVVALLLAGGLALYGEIERRLVNDA